MDSEHKCPVCGEYYDRSVELTDAIERESVTDAESVCVNSHSMVLMGVEGRVFIHGEG